MSVSPGMVRAETIAVIANGAARAPGRATATDTGGGDPSYQPPTIGPGYTSPGSG